VTLKSFTKYYKVPQSSQEILLLENIHQTLESYLWLAIRYENEFVDVHIAVSEKEIISELIVKGLKLLDRSK
jgi:hypothetical protein